MPARRIVTANEIHVPVGVPVVINTASRDVIHSFWAPNLKGKRDLIPGYYDGILVSGVDKPGIYRGQCAEFCGLQHAKMAFYIVAESMTNSSSGCSSRFQTAPDPDNDQKRHGREVFLKNQCVMCHTIRGTIAGSRVGPDLTHMASRMIARRRHAAQQHRQPRRDGLRIRNTSSRATGCRQTHCVGEICRHCSHIWRVCNRRNIGRQENIAQSAIAVAPSAAGAYMGEPSGFWGWFMHVHHTSIGKRYMVTAFVFFLLGGILALIMRIAVGAIRRTSCSAPTATTSSSPCTAAP